MTDPREPEGGSDALDAAYRSASAADASRPSDATRAAILANARAVAAKAREQSEPVIATRRPAANDPFWWRSAAASVAIALVGLMIWAPRFESGSVRRNLETAARQETVASAPAALGSPPAAAAAAQDRPVAATEPRSEQRPIPLTRSDEQRRVAAPESESRDTMISLAPPPVPSPLLAEPRTRLGMSAGAGARADAAVANAALGGAPAPAPAERAVAPSTAPAGDARKAELQEVVVTEARKARAAPAAAPAAAAATAEPSAHGSLASFAIASPGREAGLDAAIALGDAKRVRELVAPTGTLEARDAAGRTPLMRAVEAGQAAVVGALLDAGADPNAVDAEGVTPRARAANRPDIAALLAARGGH